MTDIPSYLMTRYPNMNEHQFEALATFFVSRDMAEELTALCYMRPVTSGELLEQIDHVRKLTMVELGILEHCLRSMITGLEPHLVSIRSSLLERIDAELDRRIRELA